MIPIMGEVGIGKTALARLIYNDNKAREHFELKAWANVSDHFDMFMVTKVIIVTTRIQSVASMVGTESAYIMRELLNTDCW